MLGHAMPAFANLSLPCEEIDSLNPHWSKSCHEQRDENQEGGQEKACLDHERKESGQKRQEGFQEVVSRDFSA
jgi:hypothetical protein